jgi:hypothetical protein
LLDTFKVASAFDPNICCLKSARNNWTTGTMPWDSCAFGADYTQGTYGLGEVPQVTATLGFCEENCPGVQLSTTSEWLGLLTSWVLPAIALLLVCSTGGRNREDVNNLVEKKPEALTVWFKLGRCLKSLINKVPYPIQEFMAILGDPASAIRGAFSEVALDVKVMQNMMQNMCCQERFDVLMKALAMVAGPTKFDEKMEVKLTNVLLWKGLLVATRPFMTLDGMASLRKVLFRLDESDRPLLEHGSDRREMIKKLRSTLIHGREDDLRKCLQALQLSLRRDPVERNSENDPLRPASGEECIQGQLQDAVDKVLKPRPARTASGNVDYSTRHAETRDPEMGYACKEGIEVESAEIGSTRMKEDGKKHSGGSTFEQSKWAKGLTTGIQATLKGRIDFMKGLFLPVILGLVATGGSFYSAYTQLGDNDTAHSLAYGVWYSWVIILAVVSNCYVATANPGLAKLALKHEVFLSDVTVPLRERSKNAQKWMKWLKDIGCVKDDGTGSGPRERRSKTWSSLKLLFKQTLAWICVAMPCACAASISFTTPTVGLGCRSFNHLLYGGCTLILSWLPVYRSQVDESDHTRSRHVLRALYIFGICLNVFILIGGTLFNLIGLYRNCRCEVLFVSKDFLLQMSSNTALDVANAKKFWLPVGYMNFGFVWIVCAIAVACRGYIHYSLKIFLEALDQSWADVDKLEKSNHLDLDIIVPG